ncbi:2,4-dienoyl-CoA reductase [Filobasidium floriforme]|uniref:2,4-dienoyl-CoA reductase n=1 Tax=Filobasidium floriforme TaxID=5210 RepID=UPI001E8CBC32|nr:2,4-dienoyl-CoA reductase [Filobasidium floriforme]KAH8084259.1 2,4-dienoyl-CoA reductase [Filobasidium floriforme]
MAQRYIQPAAPPSEQTFQKDLFVGKVVLSTGGRSGIVNKMIRMMMKHGADSVIIGRNGPENAKAAQQLSTETGRTCLPVQADVRKPEDLKAAAKACMDKFGRLDFVICGAAGNFLAPISGLSENAFKTVIDIDLLGTYNTIKATIPYVRQSRGSYIHISATLHYRGLPYQAHVSAAKAGVDALSQVLAVEEGPHGVRSNVIAPGPIGGTPGMERLSPKGDKSIEAVPLGRMGDGDEIATMGMFLFSQAATWITGQIFVVDGGEHHVRLPALAYPESVLDPAKVKSLIAARL